MSFIFPKDYSNITFGTNIYFRWKLCFSTISPFIFIGKFFFSDSSFSASQNFFLIAKKNSFSEKTKVSLFNKTNSSKPQEYESRLLTTVTRTLSRQFCQATGIRKQNTYYCYSNFKQVDLLGHRNTKVGYLLLSLGL